MFFTIAQRPANDIGEQLGCERDRDGHIVVNEHFATTVRSVCVAGAVAAMAMHRSLLPVERTLNDV